MKKDATIEKRPSQGQNSVMMIKQTKEVNVIHSVDSHQVLSSKENIGNVNSKFNSGTTLAHSTGIHENKRIDFKCETNLVQKGKTLKKLAILKHYRKKSMVNKVSKKKNTNRNKILENVENLISNEG